MSVTPLLFASTAAFFNKLWASESHPTSKLTLRKPRSRNLLNPQLQKVLF
ncbi:hypothetical protein GCM10008018_25480 [Paenibacillus marchantiophytorum]|uniref:Uncharacterized protein n=1 Tax=Paenibacillus marchantiophytorum TaxID=1619310 RepID=A0ABQ1ENJ1_9BACL|nr:hypothetical protein GCM10008018_25480 [Paenibacillus marchantiophytorum]